jgi:hypothetical protein
MKYNKGLEFICWESKRNAVKYIFKVVRVLLIHRPINTIGVFLCATSKGSNFFSEKFQKRVLTSKLGKKNMQRSQFSAKKKIFFFFFFPVGKEKSRNQ